MKERKQGASSLDVAAEEGGRRDRPRPLGKHFDALKHVRGHEE
jgi:hypothetical protein